MEEIGRESLLTDEEERELAARIKQGDKQALDKLTTANLRFVVSVANKYRNRGVDVSDLVSEGSLGLLRAAGRFDAQKGCRFISYAMPFVCKSMERAIAEQAGAGGVTAGAASESDEKGGRIMSADAPLGGRNNVNLLSLLINGNSPSADGPADNESFNDALLASMGGLNDREREVMVMAFGIGCEKMTFAEIGEKMGLGRERVRQIRKKALRKIAKAGVIGGL